MATTLESGLNTWYCRHCDDFWEDDSAYESECPVCRSFVVADPDVDTDADILTDQATAAAAREEEEARTTLTRAERAIAYVNAHAYSRLDACECALLSSALADVRSCLRSFSDLDIELHNAELAHPQEEYPTMTVPTSDVINVTDDTLHATLDDLEARGYIHAPAEPGGYWVAIAGLMEQGVFTHFVVINLLPNEEEA